MPKMPPPSVSPCRERVVVRGQVQGVGFRPFVFRLAHELGLSGWVCNGAQGVEIEVQGPAARLTAFRRRLRADLPDLASIDELENWALETVSQEPAFCIRPSRGGTVRTGVTPDAATCDACLRELFDPQDRRYRYPFLNCTQCGPRYTITRTLPYDRPGTTMACFAMCPDCQTEYDAPLDRRFHAQPNACPRCGPRLSLCDASGEEIAVDDVVGAAWVRIRDGEILAVRGLGGFHLVCDARNGRAVATLRARKGREEKPFAVMVASPASLTGLATIAPAEQALLTSTERPIVLLQKHPRCDQALPGVAPGIGWLGAMLPYTPLHALLLHEAAGRPEGHAWLTEEQPMAWVMTSANPGGEPLVTGNDEARQRLAGIADAFVGHDRDICVGCDDSVMRVHTGASRFIRRARGFTPRRVKLPREAPSVLATGGGFKNTVCLTRGDEAFVSQHIGDLDNGPTCEALVRTAHHLMAVLQIRPQRIACDLHPDLFSTRFAVELAQARSLSVVPVAHHHAHIAAVLAEHGVVEPALGLALDGVGLGPDGHAWGGELLRVDGPSFERLGHLRPLPLPGGDRAAQEPWRMAAAALHEMGRGDEIVPRLAPRHPLAAGVAEMLRRGIRCPLTTSAGRHFDAAAGLVGVLGGRSRMAYEGQAAILLEGLAAAHGPVDPHELGSARTVIRDEGDQSILDLRPALARLCDPVDPGIGAALFHAALVDGLARWVERVATGAKIRHVALGGGCFLNHIVTSTLTARLTLRGLTVLTAQRVPPNDGGLSLGQAWVAACGA